MPFETAMPQWNEGLRRLARADPRDKPVLDQVTRRLVADLRRRLGGPFTVDELVELYDRGTMWCTDLAVATAPDSPAAWEAATVADAAFAHYLREASDYAGGIRRGIEEGLE